MTHLKDDFKTQTNFQPYYHFWFMGMTGSVPAFQRSSICGLQLLNIHEHALKGNVNS